MRVSELRWRGLEGGGRGDYDVLFDKMHCTVLCCTILCCVCVDEGPGLLSSSIVEARER